MFNNRSRIKELLTSDKTNYQTTVMGWVRTFRNNQFIALNDGSTNNNLQVVVALGSLDETTIKRITTGACIKAVGEIIPSLGKGQKVELIANRMIIIDQGKKIVEGEVATLLDPNKTLVEITVSRHQDAIDAVTALRSLLI